MIEGNSFKDIYKYPMLWEESIKIYEDSFHKNEREDTDKILKNINCGTYKMFAYLQNCEVVGFYILDINHKLNYTLCTFLAVKNSYRGTGLGSNLCLNAISYFNSDIDCNWFLIEAEDRQAKLYKRLGFKIIDLDYQVPLFDSDDSIKTNLMMLQKNQKIDKISLSNIIKDIFQRGYLLNKNDGRLKEQLLKVDLLIS